MNNDLIRMEIAEKGGRDWIYAPYLSIWGGLIVIIPKNFTSQQIKVNNVKFYLFGTGWCNCTSYDVVSYDNRFIVKVYSYNNLCNEGQVYIMAVSYVLS